jgi:hypothetical protein
VESGWPSIRKAGECDVVSRHLQGCSPHLCRLRTDGLAPMTKYWTYRSHAGDMGPVSLVVCHRQNLGLSILLHWLAWERNWAWTHRSVSRCAADYVRSPFSREQWDPSKFVGVSRKVAMCWPCEIPMVMDYTWTECGMRVVCWSGFPLQGVHWFKSPQLSDMSTAWLWQSSRSNSMRSIWLM